MIKPSSKCTKLLFISFTVLFLCFSSPLPLLTTGKTDDIVGLDSAIITHPRVWEASGHTEGFSDPMVDCKASKMRYRADQLFYAPVSVEGEVIAYVSVLEGLNMQEEAEAQTGKGKVKAGVKALFDTYQSAIEQQTGKRMNLDYDKFQKKLVQQAKSFKQKNGNKKMSFKVVVQDGKVKVRATSK